MLLAVAGAMIASLFVAAPVEAASYSYGPPTSVKSENTSSTFVVLSWKSPSSKIKSWSIQYSRSSSFSSPSYRIINNATVGQIGSLTKSTKYYFRVRGRNASSGSNLTDWSGAKAVTTDSYAFGPPSTPTFSRMRMDSFKLSWGEVPNASKYRIQLSTHSNFSGSGPAGGSGGSPIYLLTTDQDNAAYLGRGGTVVQEDKPTADISGLIQPGKKYYVRVRALEAKADGGSVLPLTNYSGTRSAITSVSWTSYPPENFKVVNVSAAGITLSWSDIDQQTQPGTADGYRIQQWKSTSDRRYVNTDELTSGQGTVSRSGGTVTVTLKKFCDGSSCTGFTAGSAYYFRVSAFRVSAQQNNVAVSDYTSEAGVKAIATASSLPYPSGVRVDKVTDKQMTISWVPVAGAESYRIQQKLGSTGGTTRYLTEVCGSGVPAPTCSTAGGRRSVTLTKFQDNQAGGASSNLAANQVYYLRVVAEQGGNRVSDYPSNYLKVQLKGWPFDPPKNLKPSAQNGSSITMKWDAAPTTAGNVRYRLQYAKNSAFTSAKYATSAVNTASLKISGLSSETTYYFRIRVVDTNDSKTFSDYTPATGPSTARTTNDRGSVSGTLSTVAGCPVSDYRLSAYSGDETVQTVGPTGSTFTLTSLRTGGYKLQYSYIGSGNCVSPWVSTSTNAGDQSHELKTKSRTYTVSTNKTTPLGTTTAFAGATVSGRVTSAGSNLPNVAATAFGAPADPKDSYREVHDLIFTGSDGKYSLSGLWPGKKYKIYFRAASTLGGKYNDFSKWYDPALPSNTVTLNPVMVRSTSSAGGGYSTPTNLRSTAQASTSLTLAWNAVSGAPGYRIQISKSSSMSGASYPFFTSSSGTVTGLAPGTKYYFRVVVVDAANKNKLSDYTATPYPSASTKSNGFSIPTNLHSTAQASTSLTLAWNAVSGAPGYRIQISKSSSMSGASYPFFTSSSGTVTGLAPGTKYYFRVVVVDAANKDKLSGYTAAPYPSASTS